MAMLGATDTSRNVTFTALCHLTKNKESRDKVRAEIGRCLSKFDLASTLKIGHKQTGPTHFKYLNEVIQECLRINPPVPITDEFKLQKETKLGKFYFKKDARLIFYPNDTHQNPD